MSIHNGVELRLGCIIRPISMFRTKTESTSFVITTNLIIQLGKSGATLHTKYASRTHQSFRMTVYNAYMVMTYVVSTKFQTCYILLFMQATGSTITKTSAKTTITEPKNIKEQVTISSIATTSTIASMYCEHNIKGAKPIILASYTWLPQQSPKCDTSAPIVCLTQDDFQHG